MNSELRLLTNLIGISFCEKNVVFAPGSSSEEQPTRRLSPWTVVASLLLVFIANDEIFHLVFLICFKLITVFLKVFSDENKYSINTMYHSTAININTFGILLTIENVIILQLVLINCILMYYDNIALTLNISRIDTFFMFYF